MLTIQAHAVSPVKILGKLGRFNVMVAVFTVMQMLQLTTYERKHGASFF